MVKKYLLAAAYFVVSSLLMSTLLFVIPNIVMGIWEGKSSASDLFWSVVLIPFIAVAAGCTLAGFPAVLSGVLMGFVNQFRLPIFLVVMCIFSVLVEYIYCQLIYVNTHLLPFILMVTLVTTVGVCLFWRLWLEPRVSKVLR